MTYKTVLVHAEAGPAGDRRLGVAAQMAAWFDATLVGVGAQPERISVTPGVGGDVSLAMYEATQQRRSADLAAARERFEQAAGHLRTDWFASDEHPDRAVISQARGADLIVADRSHATARLDDLVLESGLPVLVPPRGDALLAGARIIIGWKDTRETRRAVTDALPFLMRAQHVHVVALADVGGVHPNDVARRLARHGISASAEVVARGKGSIARALEGVAAHYSADLLVLGGYGYSRLRERIIGGVTEEMISDSSKFILFSH